MEKFDFYERQSRLIFLEALLEDNPNIVIDHAASSAYMGQMAAFDLNTIASSTTALISKIPFKTGLKKGFALIKEHTHRLVAFNNWATSELNKLSEELKDGFITNSQIKLSADQARLLMYDGTVNPDGIKLLVDALDKGIAFSSDTKIIQDILQLTVESVLDKDFEFGRFTDSVTRYYEHCSKLLGLKKVNRGREIDAWEGEPLPMARHIVLHAVAGSRTISVPTVSKIDQEIKASEMNPLDRSVLLAMINDLHSVNNAVRQMKTLSSSRDQLERIYERISDDAENTIRRDELSETAAKQLETALMADRRFMKQHVMFPYGISDNASNAIIEGIKVIRKHIVKSE